MTDVKISALPVATSSSGADVYPLVQGGITKQITYSNLFTNVTLVTPALGTPASGTLTNCTGLPIASGVSGLGSNMATFLATPSSANLRSALTDETGTGNAVFSTSPTITTPTLAGGTFSTMFTIPVASVTAAGSTQSDAAALTTGFTRVISADGTKGVKLPTATVGLMVLIHNYDNAALKLYPATDDIINRQAANSAYTIAAYASVILVAYDSTRWFTIPYVAS